jgi:ABC-type multidrug transport system fused ATPase/permease subunit
VLGFAGAIYFFFVQHRSLGWGKLMVMASEARLRSVKEPMRGIKTVKVFNLENYFAQQVNMHSRVYLDVLLKQGMIQAAPRLFLEILLVSGAMLAMVLALTAGHEPQNIVPAMALFGVATIRILPLVTKMLQTLQNIRYSESALATLYEDMNSLSDQPSIHSMNSTDYFESLSFRNVTFSYPCAPRKAINSANLDIRSGEQIALVGLSGAGKTTLADLLLGLLKPEEGQIIHNGQPCNNVPDGLFAYVPQEPFIIHDSLRRNIALGLADHLIDESALMSAVEAAALSSLVKKLPYGLETLMGEDGKGLSGGERQRLGIARALYRDASVLIMDEPTSSLDTLTEAEILTTITSLRGRKTVILIAHRLSSIKSFDRIVFIDDGRVAASGTFRELYDEFVQFRTMVDFLSVSSNPEK